MSGIYNLLCQRTYEGRDFLSSVVINMHGVRKVQALFGEQCAHCLAVYRVGHV